MTASKPEAESGSHHGAVSWQRAHEALVGLARTRAGLDFEEGRWLVAAARARVEARLGYGSFVEYIERLFGYAPRLTQDKLRVAEALEDLPELAQALREGTLTWSSLRELTRVATRDTERAWFEAARGRTVRDIEGLVSGRRRGSLPSDPADENARKHVLRFEVSGEVLATFRDAMAQLRRDAGGPLDDDAALLLMARHVLGGPVDDGRSSYQVELTVCEDCQRTRQHGRGELVEVADEIGEMARCDEQQIASTHPGTSGASRSRRTKQSIPPALRREVLRRDQHRCVLPGCRHATFVDLHHIETRHDGGQHELDNLVTLCSAHHRAIHRGELQIEGQVSTGLRYRHADGADYGGVVSAPVADAQAQAFRALRQLGFGEAETRRALSAVIAHVGDKLDLESLLRRALESLAAGALAKAS